jgi:hypothetical protein
MPMRDGTGPRWADRSDWVCLGQGRPMGRFRRRCWGYMDGPLPTAVSLTKEEQVKILEQEKADIESEMKSIEGRLKALKEDKNPSG